jgi:hypothetical protein
LSPGRFGARRLSPRLRPLDRLPFGLPVRPAFRSTVGSTLGLTLAAFALLSKSWCRNERSGDERRGKCL